MIISFKTKRLATIFNSKSLLIKEYGSQNARFIMNRMMVLKAANNLSEIPTQKPCRCHQLIGDRKGQFALDVKHPFRLIFEPDDYPQPLNKDGSLNLSLITSIKIIDIEDYH